MHCNSITALFWAFVAELHTFHHAISEYKPNILLYFWYLTSLIKKFLRLRHGLFISEIGTNLTGRKVHALLGLCSTFEISLAIQYFPTGATFRVEHCLRLSGFGNPFRQRNCWERACGYVSRQDLQHIEWHMFWCDFVLRHMVIMVCIFKCRLLSVYKDWQYFDKKELFKIFDHYLSYQKFFHIFQVQTWAWAEIGNTLVGKMLLLNSQDLSSYFVISQVFL